MENKHLFSPSRQCSSLPVGFGQGFLSEERCDNTGASHITWLQLIVARSFDWQQHWRGGAIFMLFTSLRMRGKAEKALIKWLPGMLPAPLQPLAEVYSCTRVLFWWKCIFSYCNVLHFSGIKWFREHFEGTTNPVCKVLRSLSVSTPWSGLREFFYYLE